MQTAIVQLAAVYLLVLAGPTEALPVANDELTNHTINEVQIDNYFRHLETEPMLGDPDSHVGELVAKWTPASKVSPEELGSYFQGDILIPVTEERNALPISASRWPNAVVPYVISGSFSNSELATIQSSIDQFNTRTCLKFIQRTTERDYISIENSASGCWATAGRVGGKQKVNVQSPGCLYWRGTVMHELNHALGFLHEQSRPERDDWVNIFWGNIVDNMKFNFNKHSPSLNGLGVDYDYTSMMHYTPNAFSKNNQATIGAKKQMQQGQAMGQRDGFSKGDIWKLNRLYNCEGYEGWEVTRRG